MRRLYCGTQFLIGPIAGATVTEKQRCADCYIMQGTYMSTHRLFWWQTRSTRYAAWPRAGLQGPTSSTCEQAGEARGLQVSWQPAQDRRWLLSSMLLHNVCFAVCACVGSYARGAGSISPLSSLLLIPVSPSTPWGSARTQISGGLHLLLVHILHFPPLRGDGTERGSSAPAPVGPPSTPSDVTYHPSWDFP